MATSTKTLSQPILLLWILVGWAGFLLLPWYLVDGGLFSGQWLVDGYPFDKNYAPAVFLITQGEKLWLTPLLFPLVMPLFALKREKNDPLYAKILILTGAIGFSWLIIQGFSIGIRGWNYDWLSSLFGKLDGRQFGMGYGGLFLASSFLFLLTQGIAARGAINGDVFVVGAIGFVIAIVGAFVFFPIVNMLMSAFITEDGSYSVIVFAGKFFDDRLWGLSCLIGPGRCGVAWNSLFLAVCVGFLTTVLGLIFALLLPAQALSIDVQFVH